MMATFGEPPRPRYRAFTPTDSEKLTAFDTFWGHAGRYEIVGDTILLSPTVSKNPNLMAGGHMKLVARGHGDTLWLSGDFRNYYFRVANDLVPDTLEAWRHEDIRLIRVR
jgi:hypothetical protein